MARYCHVTEGGASDIDNICIPKLCNEAIQRGSSGHGSVNSMDAEST
jgi:hypothetical protein